MKTRLRFTVASFAAALLWAGSSCAQVITLTLTDQNPPQGWGPVHAMQPWVKRVEEATRGRVKIQVYPSQTLSKGPDSWNAVKSGVADICWCFHGYWTDMTPLSDVITLPFLPIPSAEKASGVLWTLYEKFPAMQQEYKDVKPLMLWTSTPYFLATARKPVHALEDLKGMKIRVVGGPPTDQFRALGAVPTLVPMPDNYMALDKGVLDGMAAPWEAVEGFRLYEVLKHYTMVPLHAVYFSMSMNKNKWDSLPKDVQQQIMSVSGLEGSKFWGRNFFDTAETGAMARIKTGNFTFERYELPPAEQARWRKIGGEPLWAAWVKKMESRGQRDAQKMLNTTLDLLKK